MPPPDQVPLATPHFTNQREVLAKADEAFAKAMSDRRRYGPRILVFTGPPGVGKREAARTWVRSRRDEFPDGLFHADLTDADEGAESGFLGDFLVSVGFAAEQIPSSPEGRAGLFRTWSKSRRVAVVVERAVAPAQVRSLAPAGDGSAVVVTRAGSLDGLGARNSAEYLEVTPLEDTAALDLFCRIAGQDRVAAEPDAVHEVVAIAGGLPIALCVAASMVAARPQRTMTRFVARLRDERQRLKTLSLGDEQLSLATVFNTAYERLPGPAKAVYRACGVHPGVAGFGAEALAAGLGWDEDTTFDALDPLVGARLLDERGERYVMHSLVRTHARGIDAAAGEREAVLRGMVAFYRDRVIAAGHREMPDRGWWELFYPAQSMPELPPGVDSWDWLVAERENLRAMVLAAHQLGEHSVAAQLCVMLWPLHERGKYLDDLLFCGEIGVRAARAAGELPIEALLMIQLGIRLSHLREIGPARTMFGHALSLARRCGSTELVATALESHGLAELKAGDQTAAQRLLGENLDLAERLAAREDAGGASSRRLALARFHLAKGRPLPEALDLLAEAERAFLALAPPDYYNAGKVAQWRGRRLAEDQARAAEARDALTRAEQTLDKPFDKMETLEAFGDLALRTEDGASAARHYRDALAIAETSDYAQEILRLTSKLADLNNPDGISKP
jgi:hypothetical protein